MPITRAAVPGDRGGRPSATSPHALAAAAQRLFVERGFEAVSVEDITAAVGVSRRTFFRYFAAKADVLWVESPAELARLHALLGAAPRDHDYRPALTAAVVTALEHPEHDADWARHRAQLVLTVPAVQAHAARVYARWRAAAGEHAARCVGQPADALLPLAVGHATLAGVQAAHEHWVAHPTTDLPAALRSALGLVLPPPPG
ncbi:mycofactocin system transcriptional regulator [Rhodococcus aerolatus]